MTTVVSSELINFYGMTSTEVNTFVNQMKGLGFTEITLRLNAMNEWDDNPPVFSDYAKAKDIINACNSIGIGVNIDLHTWYTTWDNSFRDSASKAASNRVKYLNYIKACIQAFSGYPVKAWMVLNEPQARTASSNENQFIRDCIATAKQNTSKPVSIRFMAGYSPSTGHYAKDIDDLTDMLCRNTYWDPRRSSTSVYGSTLEKLKAVINTARAKAKEIWFTEFGKQNNNQTDQTDYIRAFVEWARANLVDRIYAWVMQPESPSGESYNLYGGNYMLLPAANELKVMTPPPTQKWTVALTASEGGTTTPVPGVIQVSDGEVLTLLATPNTGMEFDEWIIGDDSTLDNPLTLTVRNNLIVQAEFSPPPGGEDCAEQMAEIALLEAQIVGLNDHVGDLSAEIERLDQALTNMSATNQTLQGLVAGLKSKLDVIRATAVY